MTRFVQFMLTLILLSVLIHIGYGYLTWEYWVVLLCGIGLWTVGYIEGSK